jgi:hypothetical protein
MIFSDAAFSDAAFSDGPVGIVITADIATRVSAAVAAVGKKIGGSITSTTIQAIGQATGTRISLRSVEAIVLAIEAAASTKISTTASDARFLVFAESSYAKTVAVDVEAWLPMRAIIAQHEIVRLDSMFAQSVNKSSAIVVAVNKSSTLGVE